MRFFILLWQLVILVPLLAICNPRENQAATDQLEWAAFVLAFLALSPVPASYHFVVMIFSIVLLVDVLLARREYGVAGLTIALYSLISIIEFLPASERRGALFGRLWIALLLWAVFLYCLWPDRAQRKLLRADSLRTVSLCALVAVGWSTSAYGYYRHFAYLNPEMTRRVPSSAAAYLASGVRPTSAGFAFTAMRPEGYRVLDQAGHHIWVGSKERKPIDELSFAVAQNSASSASGTRGQHWLANCGRTVELAERFGRLLAVVFRCRIPRHLPRWKARGVHSGDRRKGNIMDRYPGSEPGKVESGPNQVLDQTYDVRDVTFASSGWMMFAAKVNGRISIFSMIPGEKPRLFFFQTTMSTRRQSHLMSVL